MPKNHTNQYVGRFAPSPTGLLHFGSLVCALASYLDARHHKGKWLVRIEDIDPPREVPGAARHILETLELFGLTWDDTVHFQSKQIDRYQAVSENLLEKNQAYLCECSRQQIKLMGGIYNGHCRNNPSRRWHNNALRIKSDLFDTSEFTSQFVDIIQGQQQQSITDDIGDFVIWRKDNLPAYQLAVVVDDIEQKVTHVIRGRDLIDSTIRQLYLAHLLGYDGLTYGHIPLAIDAQGHKLSKQNLAPPIQSANIAAQLHQGLLFLNQNPPNELLHSNPADILSWAIDHWDITAVPANISINC